MPVVPAAVERDQLAGAGRGRARCRRDCGQAGDAADVLLGGDPCGEPVHLFQGARGKDAAAVPCLDDDVDGILRQGGKLLLEEGKPLPFTGLGREDVGTLHADLECERRPAEEGDPVPGPGQVPPGSGGC